MEILIALMVALGIIADKDGYSYELAVKNIDAIQEYNKAYEAGHTIDYNSDKGIIIIDKDELLSN